MIKRYIYFNLFEHADNIDRFAHGMKDAKEEDVGLRAESVMHGGRHAQNLQPFLEHGSTEFLIVTGSPLHYIRDEICYFKFNL